jgi:hypothetical protein
MATLARMTMLNGQPVEPAQNSAGRAATHPAAPVASDQSRSVGFIVGLLALIFAFTIPIVGAVMGGIAVAQARAGGYRNPLGMAGLILGIIFTVLIIVLVVVAIVLGINLFSGVIDTCQQLGPGTHQQDGITYTCS